MPSKLIDIECDGCGNPFLKRKSDIKRTSRNFCSRRCKANSMFSEIKFFSNIRRKETGCLVWKGSKNKDGYGTVRCRGEIKLAHRLAWELKNGDIPGELCVCHKCDNPPCINVDHLFLGTHLENMQDKVIKGRHKPLPQPPKA